MATIIADIKGPRRAQQQAGLEMISQGLNAIPQIMFQHHIAVQQEKAQETGMLLRAVDELGPDAVGQKGLAKLEANMGGQFPRNMQGEIVLPDSPTRMLKVAQAQEMTLKQKALKAALDAGDQHAVNKILRIESPAPDPVAVDLENKKIAAHHEEADANRAAHTRDVLISAGASKYSADQHYAAAMATIDAKPENQPTGIYLYRGKLRGDSIASRKGTPLSQGQVKFYQTFQSRSLKQVETTANIDLIAKRGDKLSKELALLGQTSKATGDLLKTAQAEEKAGNKDVAAALRQAAVKPLVDKDPELKGEIDKILGDARNKYWGPDFVTDMYNSIFSNAQAERLDSNLKPQTQDLGHGFTVDVNQ